MMPRKKLIRQKRKMDELPLDIKLSIPCRHFIPNFSARFVTTGFFSVEIIICSIPNFFISDIPNPSARLMK